MMVAPTVPRTEDYFTHIGQKYQSALMRDVRLNQSEEKYVSDMVPRIHANTKDATIMPRLEEYVSGKAQSFQPANTKDVPNVLSKEASAEDMDRS